VSALSAQQKRAARLFAEGAKQKEVAAKLGVDPRTVRRWQRLERFLLELERARGRAIVAKAAEPKPGPALLASEQPQRRWSRHAPVFQSESERYDYYQARAHLSEKDWLNWHDVRAGRLTPSEKRAIRAAGAE
jgi:hypothetical protein